MAWRSLTRKTMNTYKINGRTYFAPSVTIANKMDAERQAKVEDQPIAVNVDPDFNPLAYLLGETK